MSDLNMIKPQNVQGIINKFCLTIGMLPTSYKLSLTYEEQILAIGRYLEETVYPAINNNAEALLELQNLYQELKDYVDNYFEDLNVQEEINNKLDKMREDGTLAEIINQEIFGDLNEKIQQNKTDISRINSNITSIEENIDDIEEQINQTDKIVMFGDSYARGSLGGRTNYNIMVRKSCKINE